MAIEAALFFETVEQIYERIFVGLKPRCPIPRVTVQFRKYANANSRIQLRDGTLRVSISDMLEKAPAPIQEALANILLAKLFRRPVDPALVAQYRWYLNSSDVRGALHRVKRERGRKLFLNARGNTYDLNLIFDEINLKYFSGSMSRPQLGWSLKASRYTLGHFDPAHNVIVVSRLLDRPEVPTLLVRYVMFHEMLHLMHPTEHRGSRRCVHTREFKRAERRFENFEQVRFEVKQLVEKNYSER